VKDVEQRMRETYLFNTFLTRKIKFDI